MNAPTVYEEIATIRVAALALLGCEHPAEKEHRFETREGGVRTWCGVCGRLIEDQHTMHTPDAVDRALTAIAGECDHRVESDSQALAHGHNPIGPCRWTVGMAHCLTHGGRFRQRFEPVDGRPVIGPAMAQTLLNKVYDVSTIGERLDNDPALAAEIRRITGIHDDPTPPAPDASPFVRLPEAYELLPGESLGPLALPVPATIELANIIARTARTNVETMVEARYMLTNIGQMADQLVAELARETLQRETEASR